MDETECLRAGLEALAKDFGRLFNTDCECQARTVRRYWPSRYSEPRATFTPSEPHRHPLATNRMGNGLEVEPLGVQTAEDAKSAAVFYDAAGRPVVNANGQSPFVKPGWQESNVVYIAGPGSTRADETIRRANELIWRHAGAVLLGIMPPGRCVRLSDGLPWPSIVNLVADAAGRSVLKPAEWYVAAGRQSYSLEVWRRRDEFFLSGPMVAPELVESIGDEPENVYADRTAFLRDSELALEYLIDRLAKPRPEPEPVQQSAVRAVVVDLVGDLVGDMVSEFEKLQMLRDEWAEHKLKGGTKKTFGIKRYNEKYYLEKKFRNCPGS